MIILRSFDPVLNKSIQKHVCYVCPLEAPHMRLIEALLGWLSEAKVSCIVHHWSVQLILAYSWARPTVLVAGKGRGGMVFFFFDFSLSFIFLSLLFLFFISTISSISLLPFCGRQHKMTPMG